MTTCCGIDLRLGPVAPIKLVLTPEPIRLDLSQASPIKLNVAAAPVKLMVAPQPIKLVVSGVGVQGSPGAAWRNGDGTPSNTLGVDGDFYLDNLTGDVYQKAAGVYSVVTNITGPTGSPGPTGAKGDTGATGPNAITTATTTTFNGLIAGDGVNARLAVAGTDYLDPSAVIDPAHGGTGQSSYTNGQLLIGNTTGNTLNRATLTGTANQVNVANGPGSITLSLPQSIDTAALLRVARMGIGVAASGSASALLCVGGNPTNFTGANYVNVTDSSAGGALILSKDSTNYSVIQYSAASSAFTFATIEAGTPYSSTIGCKGGNLIVGGLTPPATATRNLVLSGGATSPQLPTSGTADIVSKAACDTAVTDRNEYSINEQGEIERITGRRCRVTTDFARTSTVTLANITGLTRNVEAGRKYAFRAVLDTSSNTGGGVKVAIGGTCTATHIWYRAVVTEGLAIVAHDRATALGTAVGGVTAVASALIVIEGEIVINAAGTLTVQFAPNASIALASTVLTGSNFEIKSLAA